MRNDSAQEESIKGTLTESVHQIKEDEKFMIDAWTGDASGILAFTGLLSATIGAFIIEFYKTLSPNSGDQTVALLGQISHQLTNSPNGTSSTANQPFSPSVFMIWVNAMWLISLVFSITSALITSLNQQAVRRYVETPCVLDEPNDRRRVHLLLFRGMKLYKMPLAILAAPALLHLSIWLFFGGLMIVFHTIYTKVAIAVDVAVGVSGLVYMAMGILPLLDFKCPYRTPITYLWLYLWRAFLSFAAYCLYLFVKRLGCRCLVPLSSDCLDNLDNSEKWDDSAGSRKQDKCSSLSNALEKAVEENRRFLTDGVDVGLGKSIINGATKEDGDSKIITWLFIQFALDNKSKLQVFAASIPRHRVIELLPPIKSGKFALRKPFLILHRSCTEGTGAVGPDEGVRRRALLVSLTAVHYVTKAPSIPDLNFVRDEFAKIGPMRVLWNDRDNSIRITSRSICALVARQVVRKRRFEEPDLRWLQEVTGERSDTILRADVAVLDKMNFKSFVDGALPTHGTRVSTEDATSFNDTLGILLDVGTDNLNPTYFTSHEWQSRLSEEIGQIYGPEGGRRVFDRIHVIAPIVPLAVPSSSVVLSQAAPVVSTPDFERQTAAAPTPHVEHQFTVAPTPDFERQFTVAPTPHVERQFTVAPTPHVERQFAEAPSPDFEHQFTEAPSPDFERQFTEAPSPDFERQFAEAPSPDFERQFTEAPSPHFERQFDEAPSPHLESQFAVAPTPHFELPPTVAPSPASRSHSAALSRRTVLPARGVSSQAPRTYPPPSPILPPSVAPSPSSRPRHGAPSSAAPPPSSRPRHGAPSSSAAPPPRAVFSQAPRPSPSPSPMPPPSVAPPPSSRPRHAAPYSSTAPPPRTVFSQTPRAAPSSSPVPPSAPPSARASRPPRTTRPSRTARPPHAPI